MSVPLYLGAIYWHRGCVYALMRYAQKVKLINNNNIRSKCTAATQSSRVCSPIWLYICVSAMYNRWPIFIVLAKCNRLSRFATPIWHQSSTLSSALIRVLFSSANKPHTAHGGIAVIRTDTHSHHMLGAHAKFCGDDAYPAGHHGRRHHHRFTFTSFAQNREEEKK